MGSENSFYWFQMQPCMPSTPPTPILRFQAGYHNMQIAISEQLGSCAFPPARRVSVRENQARVRFWVGIWLCHGTGLCLPPAHCHVQPMFCWCKKWDAENHSTCFTALVNSRSKPPACTVMICCIPQPSCPLENTVWPQDTADVPQSNESCPGCLSFGSFQCLRHLLY